MLVILVILVLCALMSLIPFIFPGTVLNVIGVFLNHVLGEALAGAGVRGGLVVGSNDMYGLTLTGVLALYGVPILAVLWVLRGR